jgi:hypothetical protein
MAKATLVELDGTRRTVDDVSEGALSVTTHEAIPVIVTDLDEVFSFRSAEEVLRSPRRMPSSRLVRYARDMTTKDLVFIRQPATDADEPPDVPGYATAKQRKKMGLR